jgi:hypothetical protein
MGFPHTAGRRRARTLWLAAAAFWVAVLSTGPARAAFDTPFYSGQAAAMGGASLAADGDPAGIFVNPAVIGDMKAPQAYFTYNSMYAGLSGVSSMGQGFLAAGLPTRFGSFALGLGTLDAQGLLQERTMSLGFARTVWDGLRLGIAGKYLYHVYEPGGDPLAAQDPVFSAGTARGAFSVDAGAVVTVSPMLELGLAVRNINQPDVGLASVDRVQRAVQLGAALRILGVKATADVSSADPDSGSNLVTPALGLEKELAGGHVAFRVGANLNEFTGGFGLRFGRIGIDYAMIVHRVLLQGNAGNQSIGLRVLFGGTP